MAKWLTKHPRAMLGGGFALGLLVGVGMLIGSWATMARITAPRITFPETALHAVATDSGETFSMATGYISEGVEGVFFLDFLTGELQCLVLSNSPAQPSGYYKYNVTQELGGEVGAKSPRYLMVTGTSLLRGGGGALRPSDCLVWVADASTGKFAAYAVPWNRTTRGMQVGTLQPVYANSARQIEIRGQ